MRCQKSNERRAVILMVVLSLLTLFALVGLTFVLYADAEAAAARVAREAQTIRVADVNPQDSLAFFLSQLIYDVPDTGVGVGSGLRGHSLARTMYGYQYPGLNVIPFNGVGRLHYPTASGQSYPFPSVTPVGDNVITPVRNVSNGFAPAPGVPGPLDDYVMVNYTCFSGDNFIRDPERVGIRANAAIAQTNPYVGGNAPYTYPDLNNFFLAAMRADGTVLTPSYHRPWLFQVATLNVGGAPVPKFYAFNDMNNPNWYNVQGKYLTLRPRPAEHPLFPLPGDATGDVKNLPWAPGGNDSIWVDLGAPVMTAPDGSLYKMMFAPLIVDLDNRINLNTAGNILAYAAAMTASSTVANPATTGPAAWQTASGSHVSNQGWGPWEVNLSKVLWGDQAAFVPSAVPTPPEWMRLFTGMSYVTPTPPSVAPIVQPGVFPPTPLTPGLSAWLLPGVYGRYLETPAGATPLFTPNAPPASSIPFFPSALGLNTTYQHSYAQGDLNAVNETSPIAPTNRPVLPLAATPTATSAFASFALSGYSNGNAIEATNHPLLYNAFQNPLTNLFATRAFRASDMEPLMRPNATGTGSVGADASSLYSDLTRLCPLNFGPLVPPTTAAQRFRNLVTTQSWDLGAPGVTPYWWNGMTTGYLTANPSSYLLAPYGAVPTQTVGAATFTGFPPVPPNPAISNLPGTNPITSEFGRLDWRALSANSFEYYSTTNPAGYTSPGAKIRLNRPLPPYPHMGALLTPPYNSLPPGPTASPYGVAFNLTVPAIANQYTAAQFARQALANDIYRRLLAISGLPVIPPGATLGTSGNPNSAQLAPRRWLAQLAVNMVDYIDEDDIMTSFNFYTSQDNYGLPLATPNPSGASPSGATYPPNTSGPDDDGPTPGSTAKPLTGANPDYWVFGTELPKVVINEALATAASPAPADTGSDTVKVWVELYNTMPAVGGTNTQPQDQSSVPLYISIPGGGGYSPYRISISQYTMDQANPPGAVPGITAQLPDNSANVLGKAFVGAPFPQSTTDADFSPANPNFSPTLGVPLSQNLPPASTTPPAYQGSLPSHATLGNIAGVDAGKFFLVGPTAASGTYPSDPFVYGGGSPGLPINTPYVQTANMTYPRTWTASPTPVDERTSGLTVMLRRLANPYLPLQTNPALPNYNPYVTVDSIQKVYLQGASASGIYSFGKTQPYAGLNLETKTGPTGIGDTALSPVRTQLPPVAPATAPPAAITSGYTGGGVVNTMGYNNWPLPPSGHYDWLVHLDRQPISPMELLHVSAWPPYKLTQQFMRGTDATAVTGTTLNTFAHYAPWFDTLPPGATIATVTCPWWYDTTLPAGQSHRLHRLFEFLECGDRAFGVNGLGRIPGKVNINTVWDPEILQALLDINVSTGTTTNLPYIGPPPLSYAPVNPLTGLPWNPAPADMGSQIFANMMNSRSPNYYGNGAYVAPGTQVNVSALPPIGPVNMGTFTTGTGFDDRPFMPLSTGLYAPTTPVPTPPLVPPQLVPAQFPNGFSAITDTILRTNNPPETAASTNTYPQPIPPPAAPTPAPNTSLLFQNYNDLSSGGPLTNSNVHPYYQSQLLTKLYNNITTRSNTFAVFLTVGFFQVIPGGALPNNTSVPQLGAEIGRAEGKQIRHRMFAVVDRTNLATFVTSSMTPVTGVTPTATNPALNMTGNATIQLPVLPAPLTITGTAPGVVPPQIYVPNLLTGVPGVITAGTQLVIDAGNVNEETITVNSVTPPVGATPATINANFALPHGVGFSIIQRGNPGPWLLSSYDPRLDFGVVQYFSIID